ncbi:hypothetical protein MHD_11225 [Mannheimia granulomatis]|uniref:Uncharacterized protein n=1 Tax=Mannheimia granulomatis TaxID=85402 RepID=A0A011MH42_9PAST|nr:hypothetical protein [Mannheimia granulomatis]EXI61816.1 hypothetical protein AK33_06675 [Mannheimia granulomatis]RGE47183.1 hypothetical protein MHD_11225 [Mannheimia granulomatis]
MRLLTIFCSMFFLISCSFGGFQPPKPYYGWRLKDSYKMYPSTLENSLHKYLTRRHNDMWSCGMDPALGESGKAKVNLCLEKKGWYLEGGPVCENKLMWNDDLCIKWRAKHSKPDAKPWG